MLDGVNTQFLNFCIQQQIHNKTARHYSKLTTKLGKSVPSSSKAQYYKIIWTLLVHKDTKSCCNKCFLASLVEASLQAVTQLSSIWSIHKAKGDNTSLKVTPCLLYSILISLILGQLPSYSSTGRSRRNIGRLGSADKSK